MAVMRTWCVSKTSKKVDVIEQAIYSRDIQKAQQKDQPRDAQKIEKVYTGYHEKNEEEEKKANRTRGMNKKKKPAQTSSSIQSIKTIPQDHPRSL
jgi:hypothetical protein